MRVQFIFARQEVGLSLRDRYVPPLGLLTLTAFISHEMPDCELSVLDANAEGGNDILERADADVVGFSVWFSNYHNAVLLAQQIKERNPKTTIVFGGPPLSGIADRTLRNNPFVDFVVTGDGERAIVRLLRFLRGERRMGVETIPGLHHRSAAGDILQNNPDFSLALDRIPFVNLDHLATAFSWSPGQSIPGHSFFPISRFRGCFRHPRCEYCSIPEVGLRRSKPEIFWGEIRQLRHKHGIDCFFETADIFPINVAAKLAETRPADIPDVRLRCYLYPGMASNASAEGLARLGVKDVFIGVESVQYFRDTAFFSSLGNRRLKSGYTRNSLLAEIALFQKYGISVMPSFVLGLKGETRESLKSNIEFATELAGQPNVGEMSVNAVMPLPGSEYFRTCNSRGVRAEYNRLTGQDTLIADDLNFVALSKAFIAENCAVSHEEISESILKFAASTKCHVAHWGL
jgi:radical SAM superfamily enzyme YgiQ (UPF0313 family)